MKNKHLSFDDRLEIEKGLKEGLSFKQIGKTINKDCTTISKEIRNHYEIRRSGALGKPFNDCKNISHCEFRVKNTFCNKVNCLHYEKQICSKLSKPPYVCNNCPKKQKCNLEKHYYRAEYAHKEYKEVLKESRQGITYNEKEIDTLNNILKPLLIDQKQSIHHAVINNKNVIMCSEKEIYNLIKNNVLDIKNIDLPRKVRFRPRKKHNTHKIDKHYLEGRTYNDYLTFTKENPDISVVQMDTVIGIIGGKCLLTIHFTNSNLMLAFLREHNNAQSVIDIFNYLEKVLSLETFKLLFPVILTDNGSEFSNPLEIECNENGEKRTNIFYCDPARPDEKGSCEVNHEQIRRILPKGSSFDNLTQDDIDLLMSHINSYKRKKLNDHSPIESFNFIYNKDILDKLNIKEIKPNDINLSEDLLKKDTK